MGYNYCRMEEKQLDPTSELLNWNFPEFDPSPRSHRWYLWFGILAALMVGLGVFTDNFLFSIIVVLVALIIFLRNWRRPANLYFAFTPQGVHIGRTFYPMKEFKSFWIVYRPPAVETLYLEFNSMWRSSLAIPLQGKNPLQIREVLLQYLPENLENDEEPLADALARMLQL